MAPAQRGHGPLPGFLAFCSLAGLLRLCIAMLCWLGFMALSGVLARPALAQLPFGFQTSSPSEFLPPDQAFPVKFRLETADCTKNCTIWVSIAMPSGYYLYRDKFALKNTQNLEQLELQGLPKGQMHFDPNLNKEVEMLRNTVEFKILYSTKTPPNATPLGELVLQGCADAGLCYPPQQLPIVENNSLASSGPTTSTTPNTAASTTLDDPSQRLAQRLGQEPWWWVLPSFFVMGLLLAFTPCVLPMVPIVFTMVLGHVPGQSPVGHRRAVWLTLLYVLGMSLCYAVLGVLAALAGRSLTVALQQPVVLAGFAGLILAMGVALLCGRSVQLPSVLQGWLQRRSTHLEGGHAGSVALMGALSALLLGPCVAPPLAGALLYIAQSANVALGGAALFVLALGMGAPLLLFAAGARRLLPQAGAWMAALSTLFGFMMVALALWVVSPVAPVPAMLLGWAVLAALCGAACWHQARAGGLNAQWAVVLSALGGLAWLLALVYVLGFFSGAASALRPLQPLLGESGKVAKASSALPFETVPSGQVLQVLAQSKQPVMLDFYADWCVACKEMELLTFSQAPVQQALAPLHLLKVDMTQNTAADLALLQHFGLFGPPAILFFPAGSAQPVQRVIGFQNTETFLQTLGGVLPRLGGATNDDKTRG